MSDNQDSFSLNEVRSATTKAYGGSSKPKFRAAQREERATEKVEEGSAGENRTEKKASKLETPENGHSKRLCETELLTYMTYNCVFLL